MSFIYSKDFFSGKRPWSLIKDEILTNYLPPYLKKVNKLKRRIILVDGFAGPGKFADGTVGSPLFLCELATKLVPENFISILVNKNKKHHEELTTLLTEYIQSKSAITIHGTAQDLLNRLSLVVTNETLLIYLDQFGISGYCFNDLVPFLSRNKSYSTELLLNINVPIIHRLSCKSRLTTSSFEGMGHRILTQTFGGDYWKTYLLYNCHTPQEQIIAVMDAFKNKINSYLDFVGYCPVYERGPGSTLKYILLFASRHIDAAILLNDIMFKAYWKHIWNYVYEQSLFKELGYTYLLPGNYYREMRALIMLYLTNKRISRSSLWCCIIKDHFMKFAQSDFHKEIKKLIEEAKLGFIDVRGTKRINDDSILYINV